jgi:hypothetical protein
MQPAASKSCILHVRGGVLHMSSIFIGEDSVRADITPKVMVIIPLTIATHSGVVKRCPTFSFQHEQCDWSCSHEVREELDFLLNHIGVKIQRQVCEDVSIVSIYAFTQ